MLEERDRFNGRSLVSALLFRQKAVLPKQILKGKRGCWKEKREFKTQKACTTGENSSGKGKAEKLRWG